MYPRSLKIEDVVLKSIKQADEVVTNLKISYQLKMIPFILWKNNLRRNI